MGTLQFPIISRTLNLGRFRLSYRTLLSVSNVNDEYPETPRIRMNLKNNIKGRISIRPIIKVDLALPNSLLYKTHNGKTLFNIISNWPGDME